MTKKIVLGKKSFRHLMSFFMLTFVLVIMNAGVSMAAGWSSNASGVTYTQADGSLATGYTVIKGKGYYFNSKGILKTGWVKTEDGIRYFKTNGSTGTIGSMVTGFTTISGKKYYFTKSTGYMKTGLQKIGKYYYYLETTGKLGTKGAAAIKKFVQINGSTYYFSAKGRMIKKKWIKNHYLGSDGKMLVSTVTPDSYLVDENGLKVKKVKTGLITIGGNVYYWSKSKKDFLRNTTKTVSGTVYKFDADGIGTAQTQSKETAKDDSKSSLPKILIIAGHGQGDSGAVSSLGQEYLKTREFSLLIYKLLQTSGKVDVTYYKDGSTSYDLYQQNVATLGSSGANLASRITGKGSIKKKVMAAMKKNANLPVLSDYDYVLEVHFNATVAASKDISGNGSYKGFGFYINSYKTKTTLEKKICSKIKKLGFKLWGGSSRGTGVNLSGVLFNARICQELGVNYALLETAFIDDKDDMTFYKKNKKAMASAIASSIVSYYS